MRTAPWNGGDIRLLKKLARNPLARARLGGTILPEFLLDLFAFEQVFARLAPSFFRNWREDILEEQEPLWDAAAIQRNSHSILLGARVPRPVALDVIPESKLLEGSLSSLSSRPRLNIQAAQLPLPWLPRNKPLPLDGRRRCRISNINLFNARRCARLHLRISVFPLMKQVPFVRMLNDLQRIHKLN